MLYSSLTTCDPGDVHETIAKLKCHEVRASVIGLGAEMVSEWRRGGGRTSNVDCSAKGDLNRPFNLAAHRQVSGGLEGIGVIVSGFHGCRFVCCMVYTASYFPWFVLFRSPLFRVVFRHPPLSRGVLPGAPLDQWRKIKCNAFHLRQCHSRYQYFEYHYPPFPSPTYTPLCDVRIIRMKAPSTVKRPGFGAEGGG